MKQPRRQEPSDMQAGARVRQSMPDLWFLQEDVKTLNKFGRLLLRDAKLGEPNSMEVAIAEDKLRDATNSLTSDDVCLPEGFPQLRLALPDSGFAPDYLIFNGHDYCSRRLRDALAQPD